MTLTIYMIFEKVALFIKIENYFACKWTLLREVNASISLVDYLKKL